MRVLESIRDHVTFKLPYDFSYQMKPPVKRENFTPYVDILILVLIAVCLHSGLQKLVAKNSICLLRNKSILAHTIYVVNNIFIPPIDFSIETPRKRNMLDLCLPN